MTIDERSLDEAIQHAREVAEIQRNNDKLNKTLGKSSPYYNTDCIKCAEEHEQLVKWLEDYKQIKMLIPIEQALKAEYNKGYSKAENDYYVQSEKDRQSSYDCGYEVGYSQSIDDFSEAVKKLIVDSSVIRFKDIDRIAEQLKVGVKE